MFRMPRLVILLALLAAASPLSGQSGQYTAPGALGVHPVDARAALRGAIDEARWKLGPLRVDPWLGVREIAWIQNDGQDGDLTVAVGAGVRAYLPVGSRLVFTTHLLPEYIWWRERSDERRLAGRHGLGMFLHANRFGLEVRASSSDQNAYATPEVQRRAQVDSTSLDARLDVPLGSRLALFVSGGRTDLSVVDEDPAFAELSDLDRTDQRFEGGVRFLITPTLSIGLGAGRSDTEFDAAARDRSNDGSYTLGQIAWNRPKLGVSLAVRSHQLEGKPGSEFVDFDGTTWQGQVSWLAGRSLSLALYGLRDLSYSVDTLDAYFLDQRGGLRVGIPVGSRLTLGGFVEEGSHRYAGGRRDDVSSMGGSLSAPLGRRLRLEIGARTTEIDGDLGRRKVSEVNFKASLGTDGLSWF